MQARASASVQEAALTTPGTSASSGTAGPTQAGRGYLAGVSVDSLALVLINVWPGWEAMRFVTPVAEPVVTVLNVGLVVGVFFNVALYLAGSEWLRAVGDVVTALFTIAVVGRLLHVFPFTGADASWSWFLRAALAVVVGAGVFALVVSAVRLWRALAAWSPD